MRVSIDFETRSTVDLRLTGVYPYAAHPTTDVWCMAWAIQDGAVQLWTPGDPAPDFSGASEIRAWSAQFERIIWREIMVKRYGFPEIPLEVWVDTAAEAAALALPRSLEQAASTLGLPVEKDMEGRRLMIQMSKPRKKKPLTWWDDAPRRERLYAYCRQDVVVERAVAERIRPLSDYERKVYLLDQRINDRGVLIDRPLVEAAQKIVATGVARANEELESLTGVGAVTKVQDIRVWVTAQGIALDDLTKATVRDLLQGEDGLPPDVIRVLEIRQEAGKTSNAKLDSMLAYAGKEDRARGLLLYHGAGTGRWSGKGPQPQNYPRGTVKEVERFIPSVLAGDYDGIAAEEPPLAVISSMLRGMLRAAPSHRLLAGDYAQIEARIVAWFAGQWDLVDLFESGGRIYEEMAADIYSVPVEEIENPSERRTIGKSSVLGCGFQMGPDRFAEDVQTKTGIVLTRGARDDDGELLPGEVDEAARAVHGYRTRYPRIPELWSELNAAAFSAVSNPGKVYTAGVGGVVKYTKRGQFLWCQLPSGRFLAYALPAIQMVDPPWEKDKEEKDRKKRPAVTYATVDGYTRKWRRVAAYGGLLTENIVQATARDLMAAAMLRVEAAGYPVVLTVHDEIVCEVPEGKGSLEEFVNLLRTRPKWAARIPVAAEGWEGERYRK